MVFLGFAIYYFLENRKLKATIDEHLRVFQAVREELDNKNLEIETLRRSTAGKNENSSSVIELTINGEFLGWNGNTLFNLSDGSLWKQAKHDVFFYKAMNPKVNIETSGQVNLLHVLGTGKKLPVERVR